MRRSLTVAGLVFCFLTVTVTAHAMDGCICGSTPGSSCYPDGCTRKTIQDNGEIIYDKCRDNGCGGVYNACYINGNLTVANYFCVTQPPCCADMIKKNDAAACCWPERAFCHPYFCKQVTTPERCGWYWTFHQDWTNRPEGYGCMKGDTESTMVPIFGIPAGVPGSQPTSTPAPPTATPYIPPTHAPLPTTPVYPTAIPVQPTTVAPTVGPFIINTPVPTATAVPFGIPTSVIPTQATANNPGLSFTLPVGTKVVLRSAIVNADKGFRAAGNAAFAVHQADMNLEAYINSFFRRLLSLVLKR